MNTTQDQTKLLPFLSLLSFGWVFASPAMGATSPSGDPRAADTDFSTLSTTEITGKFQEARQDLAGLDEFLDAAKRTQAAMKKLTESFAHEAAAPRDLGGPLREIQIKKEGDSAPSFHPIDLRNDIEDAMRRTTDTVYDAFVDLFNRMGKTWVNYDAGRHSLWTDWANSVAADTRWEIGFQIKPTLRDEIVDRWRTVRVKLNRALPVPSDTGNKEGGASAEQVLVEALAEARSVVPQFGQMIVDRLKQSEASLIWMVNEMESKAGEIGKRRERASELVQKLSAELAEREKRGASRQSKLADNLLWVIGLLLGAVLSGLLIVRIRADGISTMMLRERTVVELVSIGSFLVVVVFLGAGEFVQKETLGTLLGTLAGYLFTRRANPAARSDVENALPERGEAPIWNATNRTIALKSAVPFASQYRVWLLDKAGGKPMQIAVVSSPSFEIPAGLLIQGRNYEAWFQGLNSQGEGPAGPRVEFTC